MSIADIQFVELVEALAQHGAHFVREVGKERLPDEGFFLPLAALLIEPEHFDGDREVLFWKRPTILENMGHMTGVRVAK